MSLQSIMLLQRNVPKAAKYYSLLGFRVQLLTEGWAELDAGTAKIVLKKAGCDFTCMVLGVLKNTACCKGIAGL